MAAYALSVLVSSTYKAPQALLSCEKVANLTEVLAERKSNEIELCKNIIQIYNGISEIEAFRCEIIDYTFISTLLNCLESEDSSLQVDVLECLAGYMIENKAIVMFNSFNGAEKILKCLKSKYASVREWAGQLVSVASQSIDFVKSFIRKDGLIWMMKQKTTCFSMPSWNSAIESIFSSFLPAKFAFTATVVHLGRLDFQDVTEDGFFVTVRPCMKFFLIEDHVENLTCPMSLVYVSNFEYYPSSSESNVAETESLESGNGFEQKGTPVSSSRAIEGKTWSKTMKDAARTWDEFNKVVSNPNLMTSVDYEDDQRSSFFVTNDFNQLIPDPYLSEYLEILKKRLEKEENEFGDLNWFCIHPALLRRRVQIIAELVAEEMAGIEPNSLSIQHYKEKYMDEMKFQLGTSLIPLGYIRVGSFLERAMLFKVLSDKLGFPCALVRGMHGRAWVEVAIPNINIDDFGAESKSDHSFKVVSHHEVTHIDCSKTHCRSKSSDYTIADDDYWFSRLTTECFKAFPKYFLKPNAVVDLIYEPGKLLKLNSREANEYCGKLLYDNT